MRGFRAAKLGLCLALAGLLSVSACAERPAGPDPSPPGLDSLQPTMPAWALGASPAPGVELDEPVGGSMPWRLASIANDRRTITVVYIAGDGDCVQHAGHVVDVQGKTIILGEYSAAANRPACANMLTTGVETITLPLTLNGSVQLVHAPAADNWKFPA